MKWFFNIGILIGVCLCTNVGLSQAQTPAQPTTQCLYSGGLAAMVTGSAYDDPVRFDLDVDGHGLKLIHKVQTNYEMNNPFKPKVFAEKPTCHLKLDCVVSRQGLKNIGVQTFGAGANRPIGSDDNLWVRIGLSVAFKYDNEVRDTTCLVVGIESL